MKKVSTVTELMDELVKIQKQMHTEMGKATATSCAKVQREIMVGMTNTKTNPAVKYGKHHPSMEGDYPAVDTGRLRSSLSFEVEEKDDNTVIGKVGTTLDGPPYPFWLEYGTSIMPARPWLRPSLEKSQDFIKKTLAEAMKGTMDDR